MTSQSAAGELAQRLLFRLRSSCHSLLPRPGRRHSHLEKQESDCSRVPTSGGAVGLARTPHWIPTALASGDPCEVYQGKLGPTLRGLPGWKAPWWRRAAGPGENEGMGRGSSSGHRWRRAHDQLSLSQHIFPSKYSPR